MLLGLLKAASRSRVKLFSTLNLSTPSESSQFFASLLRQCKTVLTAKQIHQQIISLGLLSSPLNKSVISSPPSSTLGINIVAAYLACGALRHAVSLLERLFPSPVLWWNLVLRQYVKEGHLDCALFLCRRMQHLGITLDHFTFPFALKACGELPSYRRGTVLHAVVCSTGFESNVFVCNALIAMYSRCCAVEDAIQVFDEIIARRIDDVTSWNSIIAAHVKSSNPQLALGLFSEMSQKANDLVSEPRSDAVSLVNILPACASLRALPQAREIHGYALRNGLYWDIYVGNAIVDVYAKCGMMSDASKVFDGMEMKDLVSWNTMVTGYSQNGDFDHALELFERMNVENMPLNVVTWSAVISGYAQIGRGHEALGVFRQMQFTGSEPNSVTIISLLSACASIGAICQGKETHAFALRKCLLMLNDDDGGGEDLMVHNALIDMYSKCKKFDLARSLFDSIPLRERNVVTWTVMLGGHAQHGDANDALGLFSQMLSQASSIVPNAFTISCALMACARLSALRLGKQIHTFVIRNRYKGRVLFVANCLIDMYSKCGNLDAAQNVFNVMSDKNSVSWTSLMTAYGMHGYGKDALHVFEEMQKVGFVPDGVTFLVVLYACSHSGMVDQGLEYFHNMGKDYGVVAEAEHYACIIDLLGRAGRLGEAWEMIKTMPMEPTTVVWVALLSACRTHANVELGEYALGKMLELDPGNDGAYTLLSNIYANAGRWKDVARIRSLMKESGIKKRPGYSWIQEKKGTVSFFVGDRSHPLSQQIYALLATLIGRIKALGYAPQMHFALHDVDDEEKSSLLSEHSEKLALAYCILTSPPGTPIRITKNLRVCGDCHSAFMFISMIVEHEIILRDSSRFHHFKKGSCSCGGYW